MRILSFFSCLCLAVVFVSCGGGRGFQRQLEEFAREAIAVPGGMRQMVEGRDSLVLDPGAGLARLVVWVDSVTCSSCKMNRMFEYEDIIKLRDEVGEGFVPVFVFSPPRARMDEVLWSLELSQFGYPVFLDEEGAFFAANGHIPSDSRFHTFLLDRDGRVVLVGDPLNNPGLWKLYKTTITQLIENGGTLPEDGNEN
jgi:hypothetical protein